MLKGRINFIRPAVIPEEYPNQGTPYLTARVHEDLEPGCPDDWTSYDVA